VSEPSALTPEEEGGIRASASRVHRSPSDFMDPWHTVDRLLATLDATRATPDALLFEAMSEVIGQSNLPFPERVELRSRLLAALAAATPTPDTRLCGCKADTELGMAPGCAVCHHRDHGASGCLAALDATREELP